MMIRTWVWALRTATCFCGGQDLLEVPLQRVNVVPMLYTYPLYYNYLLHPHSKLLYPRQIIGHFGFFRYITFINTLRYIYAMASYIRKN